MSIFSQELAHDSKVPVLQSSALPHASGTSAYLLSRCQQRYDINSVHSTTLQHLLLIKAETLIMPTSHGETVIIDAHT